MREAACACVHTTVFRRIVQGFSIREFPGLVNFVPAVAYPFCLNLSAAFSQPGNGLIEIHCMIRFIFALLG